MTTVQKRREERRQEQLDLIQRQIDAGTLVVRRMTPEERAKFPPRAPLRRRRLPSDTRTPQQR